MRAFSHLILVAALVAAPALAQVYEPPKADEPAPEESLESGIENFLNNLLGQAQPHLDRLGRDLGDTLGSVAPVLQDIGELMDDVRNYQAPERLENGDILIRRRADAPPPPPVGDALREMLRPAPEDDPRLNPPMADPDAPRPLPDPDPESEIAL
ncbi:hypothetical protein [Paracoccus sp. N5]|uniref:hypothetical protein n=1 Tax=Paracoccus sp. N5 TaxID=1101189 RepID=UPI0003639CAC|nr:hypothetical protein [Paracoccus sp. N5]